jgi:hypothetical protein
MMKLGRRAELTLQWASLNAAHVELEKLRKCFFQRIKQIKKQRLEG